MSTQSTQEAIRAAASRYGVDPTLAIAVAYQESGFNQAARSHVGAIGVMQLMPKTAVALGVDPYNESQNIDGGVRLLKENLTRYGGDVPRALAAYNAGPSAVDKAGGVPNYPETQDYVTRIMKAYSGATGIELDSTFDPILVSGDNTPSDSGIPSEIPSSDIGTEGTGLDGTTTIILASAAIAALIWAS